MFYARTLVSKTYLSMQIYVLVACIYLSVTLPLSYLSRRLCSSPAQAGAAMIEFIAESSSRISPIWGPQMLLGRGRDAAADAASFVLAIATGLGRGADANIGFASLRWSALIVYRGRPRYAGCSSSSSIIYFGLPSRNIAVADPISFTAAVVGLGLHGGAFMARFFGRNRSYRRDRWRPHCRLGLTPAKAMRGSSSLRPCASSCRRSETYAIGLLKDTAICSIIAAPELMLRAKDLASSSSSCRCTCMCSRP